MRLFESIVAANHSAVAGDKSAGLHPGDFADSLPVIALTCIDPRLNPLMPEVLGIPEDKFIWLRNAGNIIFDPMSSMTRTLALACAVKGGREIAIIGHTDCLVGRTSIVQLTDRFRALGVDRAKLPDDLNEFFGLFASERQNVMRGVGFVRQSALIGPRVPVHGLLVDIQTGKLEWVVNGYDALATVTSETASVRPSAPAIQPLQPLPEFQMGEMKFPDFQIGEGAGPVSPAAAPGPWSAPNPPSPSPSEVKVKISSLGTPPPEPKPAGPAPLRIDKTAIYKILGDDKKVYGPVSGKDLERWMEEGRVDAATLVQKLGYKDWRPLISFAETASPPVPPTLPASPTSRRKG